MEEDRITALSDAIGLTLGKSVDAAERIALVRGQRLVLVKQLGAVFANETR